MIRGLLIIFSKEYHLAPPYRRRADRCCLDQSGRMVSEVTREANILEVTIHRWKKLFGQIEVSEAKRLKELELENIDLKKMLAE